MDLEIRPYMGKRKSLRLLRTQYQIGASSECDIVLDDPFVSACHAKLVLDPQDSAFEVHNDFSRNGVFLNGVRVERAVLPSRGVLRIGRSEIQWREVELAENEFPEMCVGDEGMRELLRKLKEVAKSNLSILILGETGTGKELIARLVHEWSDRASQKLVTLNGALLGGSLAESELFGHKKGAFTGAEENRRGAIAMAHRGSLFLDEIGDIPPAAQVKLLRTLESGELKSLGSDQTEQSNFRLISATSRPLHALVNSDEFRADLYYRIAGYVVEVPPLRNRPGDITAIAKARAAQAGMQLGESAIQKLLSHQWPGNVRELKSVLERAVVAARVSGEVSLLGEHILLQQGAGQIPLTQPTFSLEDLERQFILAQLERNDWSRKITAKQLGISRSTLFKKMKKYKISTEPQDCGNKRPSPCLGEESDPRVVSLRL